jgi:hypothetical protein
MTASKNSNLGASETRKAGDDDGDKGIGLAKKQKANSMAKPTRAEAPVDIGKRNGVELPRGGQCAHPLITVQPSLASGHPLRFMSGFKAKVSRFHTV